MRLRYWIFLQFLLLGIDRTLSSKRVHRRESGSDEAELLFVPSHRPLDATSTTAKVTRKEPWVKPEHASKFLTLPDCDHLEGGDSECEYSENATQQLYLYDYVTDEGVNDIYDYNMATTTANPEGLEEMDFVYGDIPVLNRKVVNGRRVNILEHPYVVNIQRNYTHYQVGTLISKNVVVTVAHPLYGVPIYELGILVGETYSDRRSNSLMTVLLLIFHSRFNPYTLENNILAIRFHAENLKSYTCLVKPISLHNPSRNIEGMTALVTGWGRCDSTQDWCVPRTTRYFFGELIDSMMRTVSFTYHRTPVPKACQWYLDNGLPLSSDMLCLGPSREQDTQAPCLGAPGAPLVVAGNLVALLAWGAGCGYYTDKPLIYTDIVTHVPWLQAVVTYLGSARSTVMYPLFQATQDFIRKEYLYENRKIQPKKIVNANAESLPMVAIDLDSMASNFVEIEATVLDIRDFIDNGRFRAQKQELYKSLTAASGNVFVQAPPPPAPKKMKIASDHDQHKPFGQKQQHIDVDIVTETPTEDQPSSKSAIFDDYYLDNYNDYY